MEGSVPKDQTAQNLNGHSTLAKVVVHLFSGQKLTRLGLGGTYLQLLTRRFI